MRTAQRTGGNTVTLLIQNKIGETLANSTSHAVAIFLTLVATVRNAYIPIPVIAFVALAADLNAIEIAIGGTVAHNFDMFFKLK